MKWWEDKIGGPGDKKNLLPEVTKTAYKDSPDLQRLEKAYQDSLYSFNEGERITMDMAKHLDDGYARVSGNPRENTYRDNYLGNLNKAREDKGLGERDWNRPDGSGLHNYVELINKSTADEFLSERIGELDEWSDTTGEDSYDRMHSNWYGKRADAHREIANLPVQPDRYIGGAESFLTPVFKKPTPPNKFLPSGNIDNPDKRSEIDLMNRWGGLPKDTGRLFTAHENLAKEGKQTRDLPKLQSGGRWWEKKVMQNGGAIDQNMNPIAVGKTSES